MNKTSYCDETKVFSGRVVEPLYNPRISIGRILLSDTFAADHFHEVHLPKDDQVDGQKGKDSSAASPGKPLKDILFLAKQTALGLSEEYGLQRGDILGIVAEHDRHMTSLIIAATFNGNPVLFVDPRAGPMELKRTFDIAPPKVILSRSGTLDALPDDCRASISVDSISSLMKKCMNIYPHKITTEYVEANRCDPVALFPTAGITGLPKLVPLTHELLLYQLHAVPYKKGASLSFGRLNSYTDFLYLFCMLVKGGRRITSPSPFTVDTFRRVVASQPGLDMLHLTGYQLQQVVDHIDKPPPFKHSIKRIYCGGTYISPMLIRRAANVLANAEIVYAYGLTEFGGPVTWTHDVSKKYTAGRLSNNFKLRIHDESGKRLVGIGESGEIQVRPPNGAFKGYYKDPAASDEILMDEGWCRTGDIGYVDANLDLHVIDREKHIIIYDNYVVSPLELETYICQMEGVDRAHVFGVDDERFGQMPAAAVIASKTDLREEDVISFVKRGMSDFKQLRGGVLLVDDLPRSSNRAVNDRVLITMLRQAKK